MATSQQAGTEIKQGNKRTASDIDANNRPLKRAKTDTDVPASESGLAALSRDVLTEISYHLDFTDINAMFSASKTLRNHIDWHTSTTQDFWAHLVLRKYPNFELKLAEDDEGPLPWRDIYIGTERKLTAGTQRLQKYLTLISHDPKLSQAEKLDKTHTILAKLEFQQTLLDQVNTFLDKNPTMRNFWESRVMYTQHKVLPGLEWSTENYKWDVTNTAPVNLTVIGKNGNALFLNALTCYFACYWGAGLHGLIKYEVMSVMDISAAIERDDQIDKKLLPETPYEDVKDDEIIENFTKDGYNDASKVTTAEWKDMLNQIGIADVDPKLFGELLRCAVFPSQKGTTYYTETTGYYTRLKKHVDRNLRLPGVGGTTVWG